MTDANYKDGNILRKGDKIMLYIVRTTIGNWHHTYSDKRVLCMDFILLEYMRGKNQYENIKNF